MYISLALIVPMAAYFFMQYHFCLVLREQFKRDFKNQDQQRNAVFEFANRALD
jgi:hypothetical protein